MSWVVYKSTLRLDDLLEGLIGLRKAVILMVVFITEERFTLKSEEMVHGVRSRRNCKPPGGVSQCRNAGARHSSATA